MAGSNGYGQGYYGGSAPGVPTIDQIAVKLDKTEEAITTAYNAEVSAQALACRVDPYTDDLAAALIRRVKRAKAIEAVPLGVVFDEAGATRLGFTDPEIRRLEAPYRRMPLG